MRVWRVLVGVSTGVWIALLPVLALAQEEGRTLERSEDWGRVMLFTFAGLIGVLLLATLGYLYRMRRNIFWSFQQPEAPHGDDSHH